VAGTRRYTWLFSSLRVYASTVNITFRRAGAVCAAAATAVIIGGIVPAQAATSPGWRQVHSQHYGPANDYSIYFAVVATAKNSAWVLGGSDESGGNGTSQHPVATHWNGKSWGGYVMPSGAGDSVIAASAPSTSDIWAVTEFTGDVLHWNGSRWTVAKHLPGAGELTGVTALSATNVWVFGGGGAYGGLGTWHYNGKSWQQWKGSAAGLERASALSANSIWAVGSSTAPDTTIQHFNGKTWQTVSAKALSGLQFMGIRAFSSTNIWATAVTQGGIQPAYLVHYNGASWTRIKVPWSIQVNSPVSDGHGGLWLTGISVSNGQSYVVHRTSSGAWSRTAVSAGLQGLALIPGTTSLWAVGNKLTSTASDAVIWAYGSV
jgi:hypothetical protein